MSDTTLLVNGRVLTVDALAPDNPVYIQAPTNRVPDFAVLNSAAMRAAGIAAGTMVSPYSRAECAAQGRPTGVLTGALQPISNAEPLYPCVARAAPVPTDEDVRDGIAFRSRHFAAHGIITLPGAHRTDPEEPRAYAELHGEGRSPLRIFYTVEIDARRSLTDIERYLKAVRFAANGGIGTPAPRGGRLQRGARRPFLARCRLQRRAVPGAVRRDGGPGAADPAGALPRKSYGSTARCAHEFSQPGRRRGPGFHRYRPHGVRRDRQGVSRPGQALRPRTLRFPPARRAPSVRASGSRRRPARTSPGVRVRRSTGSVLARRTRTSRSRCTTGWTGGMPITQRTGRGPHAVRFTHWQSLARRARLAGEVIGPAQRISRAEAIRCFTWNGAYALKMEHELGSRELGKRADLTVPYGDLMGCPADDIRNLGVELTLVDGRPVHGAW